MDLLAELLINAVGSEARSVACDLMNRFGTIVAVLRSCANDDTEDGLTPVAATTRLRELGELILGSLRADAFASMELGNLEAVMLYLRVEMAPLPVEVFRVMLLDGTNRLIDDCTMWAGTVDRVQVHVREVVRQALELDAAALIVAHNHTSAPARPSKEDLALTAKLVRACLPFDLRLNDHLIVGREGCYSMRASGDLDKLERDVVDYGHKLERAA